MGIDYFSGTNLIGEDFTDEEARLWFADEEQAYANLRGHRNTYEYQALNEFHAFRFLGAQTFDRALSVGGYDGAELLFLRPRIKSIVIAETATNITASLDAEYVRPRYDGSLPLMTGSFDLVTCLNVLHHVPKPSHSIAEMARCLKSGGFAVFSEPIVSMGDWNHPRPGLTARERGIPVHLFNGYLANSSLRIVHHSRCAFGPLMAAARILNVNPWATRTAILADAVLSKIKNRSVYHARNTWQKIRPTQAFWVTQKI